MKHIFLNTMLKLLCFLHCSYCNAVVKKWIINLVIMDHELLLFEILIGVLNIPNTCMTDMTILHHQVYSVSG